MPNQTPLYAALALPASAFFYKAPNRVATMTVTKPVLLVNLPPGFFTLAALEPTFARLELLAEVRRASCNGEDEILPHLREADAVFMWSWPRLTDALLAQCPRLRFAAFLDVRQPDGKRLLERGMPVSLAKRAFSPAVAEMALTLILATLRKIEPYQAAMRRGTEGWVTRFPDALDPDERELTGRKVGIVGLGGVGQRLAELLAPFRCDLQTYDPYLPDEIAARFGATKVSLDALAARSEVLVLCAAANVESKHLLTARHIEALPPRAILINVARASLVDESALRARLERGDLYAALDVFDKEPLPADSFLRTLPNAFLTPHRAGGTIASVQRLIAYLADDYEAFLSGVERRHALTPVMLPALDT